MYHTFFKCVLKHYIYINIVCMQRVFTSFFWLICLHIYLPPKNRSPDASKQAFAGGGLGKASSQWQLAWNFFLPSLSCIFFGTLKGSLHKAEWIAWWACRLASWKAQWNHDLGQTHVQTKKKDGKQKKMCQILAKQAPSPGPKVQRLNFVNFCFF